MTLAGTRKPNSGTYRFVIQPQLGQNPRSTGYLEDAHALGFTAIEVIQAQDLIFVEGSLGEQEAQQLAGRLLMDPLTQTAEWVRLQNGTITPDSPSESGCF